MSLNYQLDKIENWQRVTEEGQAPETHALIFATLAVDIGTITAANASEFWTRLDLWQKYVGAMAHRGDGSDLLLSLDDVLRHIGLQTNVSERSRSQWLRQKIGGTLDDVLRSSERRIKAATCGWCGEGPDDEVGLVVDGFHTHCRETAEERGYVNV
jgi:hypothetical protein